MTEDRKQRSEVRGQRSEDGRQKMELRSGTRRRPIGWDYAAAKDAEVGKKAWGRALGAKKYD
jgi:hypothetical protein